jgi:transposase
LEEAGIPIAELDESGVEQNPVKDKGWSLRGVKIYCRKNGRRKGRKNVIGAVINGKHVAVMVFDCTINSDVFEAWFEMWLLPQLPKGCAIIMDNACFHRNKILHEIAGRMGFILLFLPKYSPDKNSIEHSWANMKRWLKSYASYFLSLKDAIYYYFNSA